MMQKKSGYCAFRNDKTKQTNDKNTNWPVLKTMLVILNSYIKPVSLSLRFKMLRNMYFVPLYVA